MMGQVMQDLVSHGETLDFHPKWEPWEALNRGSGRTGLLCSGRMGNGE